jgi:hypothetical protein
MSKQMLVAVALVVVAGGAYLAGGEAGSKPALKFPYLPAEDSQPCGLTVFELDCLKAGFKAAEPKPIGKTPYNLVGLEFVPDDNGVVVKAHIAPKTPNVKPTAAMLGEVNRSMPKGKTFRAAIGRENTSIPGRWEYYLDGKLIGRTTPTPPENFEAIGLK